MSHHLIIIGLIFINCLMIHPIASQRCKYWCKAARDQFYCCPDGGNTNTIREQSKYQEWPLISDPSFWMGVLGGGIGWNYFAPISRYHRPKQCPPLRTGCPRTLDYSLAPNVCENDYICGPEEKCCYDVCIEHKVCKPAE